MEWEGKLVQLYGMKEKAKRNCIIIKIICPYRMSGSFFQPPSRLIGINSVNIHIVYCNDKYRTHILMFIRSNPL